MHRDLLKVKPRATFVHDLANVILTRVIWLIIKSINDNAKLLACRIGSILSPLENLARLTIDSIIIN
jgi:hypothetical protein